MKTYLTSIKVKSLEPFLIFLTGWPHATEVVLNDVQKAPFLDLGISGNNWLAEHAGWLYAEVNLGVSHPRDLQFRNLQIDDRPTPTDAEFLELDSKQHAPDKPGCL